MSDDYSQRLEASKRASVGQLLFQCSRLWNEQAIERVQARRDAGIRMAHTRLFPHIDLEGTRPSTIAERAGITRQAAGKLLHEMEALGLVEWIEDPSDRRASLVRYSAAGREGLLEGLALLRQMERELATGLGEQRMQTLHTLLLELRELLAGPDRS
jgi:DNA-binding MarR family transcriptional regulator